MPCSGSASRGDATYHRLVDRTRPRLGHSWLAWATGAACCLLVSCSSGVDAPALPEVTGADELPNGRLLLFPVPSPERLLGRAVTRGADGSFSIAEDIAPGCELRVVREPSRVTLRKEANMKEATNVGAGYASVASFQAKWGKDLAVRIEADNQEIVRADLSGPCGEEVVSEVYVGTGARKVVRGAAVAVDVRGGALGVQAGGGTDRSQDALDEMKWTEPQAYAFRTRASTGGSKSLEVEVRTAPKIIEGDAVRFTITTSEPASLVVFYLGADGKGDQLVPSNEDPRPRTLAQEPFSIPTAAQERQGVKFVASLLQPGKPAKERLLVYAFKEEGDFAALRGVVDEAAGDAPKLEELLNARLANLPPARFRKRVLAYTIEPKG